MGVRVLFARRRLRRHKKGTAGAAAVLCNTHIVKCRGGGAQQHVIYTAKCSTFKAAVGPFLLVPSLANCDFVRFVQCAFQSLVCYGRESKVL